MPFDPALAKKTVTTLQAHRNHPGGDVMLKAADLLMEAVNDAGNSMGQIRTAEASAADIKRKYDDLLLEMKAVREKGALLEGALTALRAIATGKRGGNKMAAEFLERNNLAVSTEVVTP
jgi:hypothetical protein